MIMELDGQRGVFAQEAARLLGIEYHKFCRKLRAGDGPAHVKVGHRYFVPLAEVERIGMGEKTVRDQKTGKWAPVPNQHRHGPRERAPAQQEKPK